MVGGKIYIGQQSNTFRWKKKNYYYFSVWIKTKFSLIHHWQDLIFHHSYTYYFQMRNWYFLKKEKNWKITLLPKKYWAHYSHAWFLRRVLFIFSNNRYTQKVKKFFKILALTLQKHNAIFVYRVCCFFLLQIQREDKSC